jgi:hypothetical protein
MPPGSPPAAPKATSLTNPLTAWTNKGQVNVGFAYGTNYLTDTQQAMILDVEATLARWSAEVAATKTMLERTRGVSASNRGGWQPMPLTDPG